MKDEECIRDFGGKPEGRDQLENLGLYGGILLKLVLSR
jgi:hypothetical protein